MATPIFQPGFRISTLDIVVLVVGSVAATGLANITWWWGFVLAFVIGHFFLFCNVFRLARPLELVWAGIFVILSAITIAMDVPGWAITAAASIAATFVLVIIEMRKPSYHGIGWQRINPHLPAWWESNSAKQLEN